MQPPSSSRNAFSLNEPLLQKGDLVAGRYRVERVIGNGGMGQVVAARHIELGNLFAIKVLRPNDDQQALVRFMREAQAIARIQNEHVVRVHDVGETERGMPYIVMEHLDGQDLGALLAARGPLPVDEAVGAILEACDGLADAHAMGIVHRDLKPQNLFLARKSASGAASVKIVDFGLAKSTSTANGHILSAKATANGEIVGTAGYLAPEQMSGEATPRSDVWSLGVSLYRLLTGKHPFGGKTTVEISVAALTAEFRPLSYFRNDVPPAIEAVIARCLRKIPEERYADARVLHDALLEAFSAEAIPQSHTAPTLTRGAPPSAASMMTATAMTRTSAPPHQAAARSTHPQMFAPSRDDEATIIKPRASNGPSHNAPTAQAWEPSGAPTSFTTSEEGLGLGTLDRRSRLMLLWSGIALMTALLFLFAAIAWRRSAAESRHERETQAAGQPPAVFPPPPPLPPEVVSHVAAPPSPPPAPVESPPATPLETVSAPPPPPPAPEPVAVAPVVEAPPPPPPPAPTTEPVAAPVERAPVVTAPAPAKKPPVKKKALYDTP